MTDISPVRSGPRSYVVGEFIRAVSPITLLGTRLHKRTLLAREHFGLLLGCVGLKGLKSPSYLFTMAPLELRSFDPFAIHPFTNSSGVIPPPPLPSQYPTHTPSVNMHSYTVQGTPSSQPPSPLYAPQPRHVMTSPSTPSMAKPIFVPFRKDSASPDLVLKKKSPKDLFGR